MSVASVPPTVATRRSLNRKRAQATCRLYIFSSLYSALALRHGYLPQHDEGVNANGRVTVRGAWRSPCAMAGVGAVPGEGGGAVFNSYLKSRRYPSESPLMSRSWAAERLAVTTRDVMG